MAGGKWHGSKEISILRPVSQRPISLCIKTQTHYNNSMNTLFGRQYNPWQVWVSRLLIAIVLFWNLQAAFYFMLSPQNYVASFQLEGVPGKAAIMGIGILFLMWQVPYILALLHPVRFRVSLLEAVIMQSIGFVAETGLLFSIPMEYQQLRSSILRFIIFDGAGLLLLIGARVIISRQNMIRADMTVKNKGNGGSI